MPFDRSLHKLLRLAGALSLRLKRLLGPDWPLGFLFVPPIVMLMLALVAYPFCDAIYLSMTRKVVGWFPEAGTAMPAVIFVNIWRGFPFFGISFLAGMKAIPAERFEAASVDGANAFQRFVHVTLPGLRNIVIIVVYIYLQKYIVDGLTAGSVKG